MFKIIILISIFALCNAESPFSTLPVPISTELDEQYNYRLPNNTKPINYEVHLRTTIDKGEFGFDGRVVITLEAVEVTKNITIQHRQVDINDVVLADDKGNALEIDEPTYDTETEHFVIPVVKDLAKGGKYTLTIKYNATLRDDLSGFHKSWYKDEEDNTVWQAGTHFEPHNARHAFPCYDEPAIRATFDISITHADHYHAVSNMPVKSRTQFLDTITTLFEQTQPVQTYLIAFVVSDFSRVTFQKENGIFHDLYAKPAAIRHGDGDFGLVAGEKILTNQAEYFGTEYVLPKMSQIAMPNFGAGAMENWGIVIYTQNALLYDEEKAEVEDKHGVGHIIGHEFAHQWFGDHVAPKWWSYLWLNEGFATLYAAHTMSLVYPEFRDLDLFITSNLHGAMRVDATGTSRPMTYYVENHAAIRSLFDDIAYSKSGAVLRMFQHALSEETWKKGLKYYLDEMGLKAADSDDLARNLKKAADEDKRLPERLTMKDFVDSWTRQGGVPVIAVSRNGTSVTIVQSKFVNSKRNRADTVFIIPINFATASHVNFTDTFPVVYMQVPEITFDNKTFHAFGEHDWMVFNVQETGYYRVNYDEHLWHLISMKLNSETFDEIHLVNRAQLIDDVLTLARNDLTTYEIAFKILAYLERETDFLPWTAANNGLNYLNRMMTGSEHYSNFQRFVAKLVGPLYEGLGSHDLGTKDSLSDKRARSIALNWACISGEQKCITDTTTRVNKVLDDPELEIEANVRSAIYCNGLRQATQEMFDKTQERLTKSTDVSLRRTLINGMGCIVDGKLHQQNLDLTLDDKTYNKDERTRVLQSAYMSGGRNGVEAVIGFFSASYEKIDELYGEKTVRNNMYWMSDYVTSQTNYDKFVKLIDQMIEVKILVATEKQGLLEEPDVNMEWLKQNNEEIGAYFKGYFGSGASEVVFSSILVLFGVFMHFFVQ